MQAFGRKSIARRPALFVFGHEKKNGAVVVLLSGCRLVEQDGPGGQRGVLAGPGCPYVGWSALSRNGLPLFGAYPVHLLQGGEKGPQVLLLAVAEIPGKHHHVGVPAVA